VSKTLLKSYKSICCNIDLRRWEDNIKTDLQKVGWGEEGHGLDDLAQDRDRWWVLMNPWVP